MYDDVDKRVPEIFVGGQKRNIISALRAKMRRSKTNDVEEKLRFSPVLSIGELADGERLRNFRFAISHS